mmetsp:Transcript_48922/g.156650  ORF Transcript_48922/g.156650 Transcript_48922/m.156650 type:complete len:131 (+) Transcript_48922:142-534(+)
MRGHVLAAAGMVLTLEIVASMKGPSLRTVPDELAHRLWPNAFILGAPKAGTTFLANCLEHSKVFHPTYACGEDVQNWRDCNGRAYLINNVARTKELKFYAGKRTYRAWWNMIGPEGVTGRHRELQHRGAA